MKEVKTGKPWGDLRQDTSRDSHLRSHVEERYYVPSLVVNALEATGASQVMRWWMAARLGVLRDEKGEPMDFSDSGGWIAKQVQKHITKYIRLRTGVAA